MATGKHGKFREIWTCGFRDMRADRQTDVDHNTSYILWGEVTACLYTLPVYTR